MAQAAGWTVVDDSAKKDAPAPNAGWTEVGPATDQRTKFEKDRTDPSKKRGVSGGMWDEISDQVVGGLESLLPTKDNWYGLAGPGGIAAPAKNALTTISEWQRRKDEGRSKTYRALTGATELAGIPTGAAGQEESADKGDVGGVLGHAMVPALEAVGGAIASAKYDAGAEARNAKMIREAHRDTMMHSPPTKTTPFELSDVVAARPYMEEEHVANPVQEKTGIRDTLDNYNSAVKKIEGKISEYVKHNPQDTVNVKPLDRVASKLAGHPLDTFAPDGLKALQGYNLDKPMTLARVDEIRHQMNAENDSYLRTNNAKQANARTTDPGFAAREIAAEELRNGIYDGLERRGFPGIRQLRRDEGSLLKLRNATQAQYYKADSAVAASAPSSPARAKLGQAVKLGSVALGAETMGVPGAIGGELVGEAGKRAISGKKMTRNELAARSYKNRFAEPVKYPTLPPRPKIAGQLTAGPTITPYSDSSYVRAVPAQPATPGLKGTELAKVPGSTPTTHLPDSTTPSGTRRVTTAPKTPYSPPAEPPHPLLNAGERPLGAPPSPTAHGAPGPLQRLRNMAGETPEGASYPQKKTPPDVTRLNPATNKLEVWNGRKWGPVEAREGLVHDPEGPDVPEHKMYRKMSTDAGVEFMGMQEGGKTPWVLFRDPESGTTLGLRQSEFTPENIKKKIAASRASQPIRPKGMTPPPRTPTDDFDF